MSGFELPPLIANGLNAEVDAADFDWNGRIEKPSCAFTVTPGCDVPRDWQPQLEAEGYRVKWWQNAQDYALSFKVQRGEETVFFSRNENAIRQEVFGVLTTGQAVIVDRLVDMGLMKPSRLGRLFHVTRMEDLPLIFEAGGVLPCIEHGVNRQDDSGPLLYSFPSINAMRDARWLKEALAQVGPESVVVLETAAPEGGLAALYARACRPIRADQFWSLHGHKGMELSALLVMPRRGAAWSRTLKDGQQIAEYMESMSAEGVDRQQIEDRFVSSRARLQLVPTHSFTTTITPLDARSVAPLPRFAKLLPATRPPILIENGVVVDGNHRVRDARYRAEKYLWAYVVEPCPAPEMSSSVRAARRPVGMGA